MRVLNWIPVELHMLYELCLTSKLTHLSLSHINDVFLYIPLKETSHMLLCQLVHSKTLGHLSCSVLCSSTWSEAVELLLDGLLGGQQHQVPDVQDLHGCHGILVHLHLRLRPVHGDGVTPQLNTT